MLVDTPVTEMTSRSRIFYCPKFVAVGPIKVNMYVHDRAAMKKNHREEGFSIFFWAGVTAN